MLEAVQPSLAGFSRHDHWMVAAARVFAGMTVRRGIAAERDAARLTGPQMYPAVAALHALFAFMSSSLLDVPDGIDVGAGLWHNSQTSISHGERSNRHVRIPPEKDVPDAPFLCVSV
jgi:hypothetical protein